MATQLSAITLVGTTGQGYADGMRFVQFYFGLPIAMVILSVTVVPFFYRADVYTAYEYLERRFDARTRTLASLLFLLSRGLSCGVIIAAPAVILSIVLGWNLHAHGPRHRRADGALHDVRRRAGGDVDRREADGRRSSPASARRSSCCSFALPDDVSLGEALHIAGRDRPAADLRLLVRPRPRPYTFWSGLIGGLFLMLSYFGCDQSQVQRYLTAKSVDEARSSLLMSAYWKIPLQALILLIGVLVFVFYLFTRRRCSSTRQHDAEVRGERRGAGVRRAGAAVHGGVRRAAGGRARAGRGAARRRDGDGRSAARGRVPEADGRRGSGTGEGHARSSAR